MALAARPGRHGIGRRLVEWRRRLVRRWVARLAAFVALAAVVVLVRPVQLAAQDAVMWALSPLAPSIVELPPLPAPTKIVAADGTVLAVVDGGREQQPVGLADLPRHVVDAVLAAEDAEFESHPGVDLRAVVRAVLATGSGDAQGGSTITEQLAKLNYTGTERTVTRRVRQVLYARELERRYTKDELLERYVNQVYFGDGTYGIAAAAHHFFGVPPQRLTLAQAAVLAGKIRAPEALDPRRRPAAVRARRNEVLRAMRDLGWLVEPERRRAAAEPIRVVTPSPETAPAAAPHFVSYVQREALTLDALGGSPDVRRRQLETGGYTVRTTLDRGALDAAVEATRSRLGQPGDPAVAVASVRPGDGAIETLFGGLDATREFDLASQGRRQPGSAFKPFVLLAAIEAGIDPRSMLDATSPRTLAWDGRSFTVRNYEGEDAAGPLALDEALVHSVNVVYAQLGLIVGPERVVAAAERAGIGPGNAPVPAVALGGLDRGVSPLEMATAYATFAARGTSAAPYSIASVLDARGRTVYERRPTTRKAFDDRVVGMVNAALEQVVHRGTGRAATIDRPAAGKTGTTSNLTNAWFVGFTPDLATAVWMGDPDRDRPLGAIRGRPAVGGGYPAEIFAVVMRAALASTPASPVFTAPPDALPLRRL